MTLRKFMRLQKSAIRSSPRTVERQNKPRIVIKKGHILLSHVVEDLQHQASFIQTEQDSKVQENAVLQD